MGTRLRLSAAAAVMTTAVLVVPVPASGAAAGWLAEVNRVRTESGLGVVTADAANAAGMKQHIYYLVHDKHWQTGAYADQHDENPAAPDYSASGRQAGETSVIAFGTRSDEAAVDSWWAAPIHASDIMKPDLTTVAYYRDPASGDAMLFTDGGLAGTDQVVEYPGDGGTTHLTRFGGENPDPTKSCPSAYHSGAGLPLFAILPTAPSSASTVALTHDGRALDACVIDQNNFDGSADPVYGPTALQYFQNGLVLIIPREPLVPGDYTVALQPGGQAALEWTFHSDPTAMPPGLGYAALCSFTNPRYASGQAQVGISNPPDTTTTTTYTVRLAGHNRAVRVADGSSGHTTPFVHLSAGSYRATVIGDDNTSGSERVRIAGCPAWQGVRLSEGASYSASKHRINQPASNRLNTSAVTIKVRRSHLSSLTFHLKGKSTRVLHIGVRPHGTTEITYTVGRHTIDRGGIQLR